MLHLYQDTPIGGGDALYAMADVNINNPEDGQMLVYDASTQRWRNVTQKSLNDLAEVTDLTNVIATGSTNTTGATIPKGLYFYLNDELCQAKVDIANGATFTLNTNYEVVTAGGLNSLNSALASMFKGEYWATPFVKYGSEWYAIVNLRGIAPDTNYTVGDFSFLGGGTVPAMTATKFTYGIRFVCNTDVTGRVMKLTVS
jgi:hypothetical protein